MAEPGGHPARTDHFMMRALDLAERGRRTVSPNPMVGCVLVADGVIVGEGWHVRAGGPHAEVVALTAAGQAARGATAYVTLEPCAHAGRTGPCTSALIQAGVARVEVALPDPNPIAAGGAAVLRAAGVEVHIGRSQQQAREQNRVFLHACRHGRPFVILKAATSLDGRIAAADGTSQWLTGPLARGQVHELRAEVDAVLVGSGTVLADDPLLTARPRDVVASPAATSGSRLTPRGFGHGKPGHAAGKPECAAPPSSPQVRQPLRVVLDARGRVPSRARVLDDAAPTLVITTDVGSKALPDSIPRVVVPAFDAGSREEDFRPSGVDLVAALGELMDRGVRSILVEGGARVASAFWSAGLVDRLELHVAPLILGDRGRPLFLEGPATLSAAQRLNVEHATRVGDDIVLSMRTPHARPTNATT